MVTVIGIRFKKAGKVYYFDPGDVWPNPGDFVVVETARGVEMGEVVTSAREVDDEQIVAPLKKVVRMAVEEDIRRMEYNVTREREAFRLAQDRIQQHKLDMKLVDVEYTFDNTKIIFYFTANGRVDFRDLVKDLASVFKMRIELRQIGVRDEAKMLGGLGSCGRTICCAQFLGDFQPVSIKMAKEQNLSLNPTKISGQCGRLMCCLKYEQDYYESALKRLPKLGREIMTPDGIGIVSDINVIREKVKVRIRTSEDSIDVREYGLDEVYKPAQGPNAPEARQGGEASKQQRIDGMNNNKRGAGKRRDAKEPGKPQGKQPEKDAKSQAEQEKLDKQKERRILNRRKSKQLSTDQFFDKLVFERTEKRGARAVNPGRKSGSEEPGAKPDGAKDAPEKQQGAPRRKTSPDWDIPKPSGGSVKPGDTMNS